MFRGSVLVLVAAAAIGSAGAAVSNWQVVPSQNFPASNFDQLDAVVSTGPGDGWAVGFARLQNSTHFQAVTERWNGSSWRIVPATRNDSAHDTRLLALDAAAPDDVWAAGTKTQLADYTSHGLLEHWDGHGWREVAHAADEPPNSVLLSVDAVTRSDAWAVGYYTTSSSLLMPLIEHWNGTSWSVVTGAFGGQSYYDRLLAVAALGPDDVWALGTTDRHPHPVVEHWNGTQWRIVAVPESGYDSELVSVAALGPDDIWAVGSAHASDPLIEHWDGSRWSIVQGPGGSGHRFLAGVAALGPNDVWAVGGSASATTTRTLVEHWDGNDWAIVSSPPADTDAELLGMSAGPSGMLLSVGYQNDADSHARTLVIQR